ncbi:MAG: SHOCT domain-containing protein [Bacteroidia bacterium]
MEVVFGLILVFGILYVIVWLSEKFNGTTIISHTGQRKDVEDRDNLNRSKLENLYSTDPENVAKAIDLCKRKGYAITSSNVLIEYDKVLKGDTLTVFEKIGRNAGKTVYSTKKLIKDINLDKSSLTKKINELNNLKEAGLISEEEFNNKKKELLDSF